MKLLIGMPVYKGIEHTKLSLESLYETNNNLEVTPKEFDVLLVQNGADEDIKKVVCHLFLNGTRVIINPINQMVNPAWNQILEVFNEKKQYTHLAIMSSDLILQKGWFEVLEARLTANPDEIPIVNLNQIEPYKNNEPESLKPFQVNCCTPGVFIVINRKKAEILGEFPTECKLWFGDEYYYTIMRALGYKTMIIPELKATHYNGGSHDVQQTPNFTAVIEQDKVAWETVVKPRMIELIEKLS